MGESHSSAEMLSVYSVAQADKAMFHKKLLSSGYSFFLKTITQLTHRRSRKKEKERNRNRLTQLKKKKKKKKKKKNTAGSNKSNQWRLSPWTTKQIKRKQV